MPRRRRHWFVRFKQWCALRYQQLTTRTEEEQKALRADPRHHGRHKWRIRNTEGCEYISFICVKCGRIHRRPTEDGERSFLRYRDFTKRAEAGTLAAHEVTRRDTDWVWRRIKPTILNENRLEQSDQLHELSYQLTAGMSKYSHQFHVSDGEFGLAGMLVLEHSCELAHRATSIVMFPNPDQPDTASPWVFLYPKQLDVLVERLKKVQQNIKKVEKAEKKDQRLARRHWRTIVQYPPPNA